MTGINKRSNRPNEGLQRKVDFNPLYLQFGIIKSVGDRIKSATNKKKK